MKDKYYGDNRDLIKWGGIVHLCKKTGIKDILQIAYYRVTDWPAIQFKGREVPMPDEVQSHFKDIADIKRLGKRLGLQIHVYGEDFASCNRQQYHNRLSKLIANQKTRKCVFLDPDTGIGVKSRKAEHVRPEEISSIWQAMKCQDYLVLYQHGCRDTNWQSKRKTELAEALNIDANSVMHWAAPRIASDVVFFFCEKK